MRNVGCACGSKQHFQIAVVGSDQGNISFSLGDPDNPGKQRITFRAVEGFEPPPVEELATAE